MTNATTMERDAFGMSAAAATPVAEEPGTAVPESGPGGEAAKPPKKPTPVLLYVGLGFLLLLACGVVVMVVVSIFSARGEKTKEASRPAAADVRALTASDGLLRSEVSTLKESIQVLQDGNQQLRAQLDQVARAQDTRMLEGRVKELETALQKTNSGITGLSRKIADAKPLDADLLTRDDARIVSLGSGVARITQNDRELVLHRGDRWNGLVVREIRSDRGVVLLSDGSIIK